MINSIKWPSVLRSVLGRAPLTIVVLVLMGPVSSSAQMTTERFIPIGQSPGLSGRYTWLGDIVSVDQTAGTFTVRNAEGSDRTIRVTDSTRIWVDRSASRQTNTVGGISDLVVGRRTEIKYIDYQRREVADWIKVASG